MSEPAARGRTWPVLEIVGLLAFAAPALTALLLYLSFVRTQVICDYFGVEISLLGFSSAETAQEFGLRSAGLLTDPLPVLAVAVLALLSAHLLATRLMRRLQPNSRWHRVAVLGATGVGVLLLGIALDGLGQLPAAPRVVAQQWAAVSLGAGAALLEYAAYLAEQHRLRRWRQLRRTRRRRSRPAPLMSPPLTALRRAALGSLAVTALLWGLTVEAARQGARVAHDIALTVPERAEVLVYTKQRLQLAGQYNGVSIVTLPGEDGWRFRYAGLHVLFYSNSRWFLLPAGWRPDNGSPVVILTDDPGSLRVDMRT